jgi:hypothetical protein
MARWCISWRVVLFRVIHITLFSRLTWIFTLLTQSPHFFCRPSNPFWDSKPELFSDIACLRIPYQPCIVLFGNFFSCTPATNRHELCLHLNVVPTAAGVFKSRHILLHKYVNRIMITYLWCQIQLIIPSRRFRSIECRHFDLFWKYVTWSLFPRIMWYSLFHTSCSIGIQLSMLCSTAELV